MGWMPAILKIIDRRALDHSNLNVKDRNAASCVVAWMALQPNTDTDTDTDSDTDTDTDPDTNTTAATNTDGECEALLSAAVHVHSIPVPLNGPLVSVGEERVSTFKMWATACFCDKGGVCPSTLTQIESGTTRCLGPRLMAPRPRRPFTSSVPGLFSLFVRLSMAQFR